MCRLWAVGLFLIGAVIALAACDGPMPTYTPTAVSPKAPTETPSRIFDQTPTPSAQVPTYTPTVISPKAPTRTPSRIFSQKPTPSAATPTYTPTAASPKAPTETPSSAPTITPTATVNNTPTQVSSRALNIDQNTLGRDLFNMLTKAETECIRADIRDHEYENLLDTPVLSTHFYFPSIQCLDDQKTIELSLAFLDRAIGGLSGDSRSCLEDVYIKHGGVDLGFILYGWDSWDAVSRFYPHFKACLEDDEAAALSIRYDQYVRPPPSQVRCLLQRIDSDQYVKYIDLRRIAVKGEPPSEYAEIRDALLPSFSECGIDAYVHDEPPTIERGRLLWRFRASHEIRSSPVIGDGTIYVVAEDERLYAVDAATGELKWRKRLGLDFPMTYSDGRLFVTMDSELRTLDANTGSVLWSYDLGSESWSTPAVAEGIVYVATDNYGLHAVDVVSGEPIWKFKSVMRRWASPAIGAGVVYIRSLQRMYTLDATTGAVVWESGPLSFTHAQAPMVTGEALIFVQGHQLTALDSSSGALLWEISQKVKDDTLIAVSAGVANIDVGQTLDAIDVTTGNTIWQRDLQGPITAFDGVLYVGGVRFLTAVNAATGESLWRYPTYGAGRSVAAVVNGVVYFGSTDDHLYALTTASDAPEWSPPPTRTPVKELANLIPPEVDGRPGWGLSGASVAANTDASVIVVGDPGAGVGAVYVYTNPVDDWSDVGPEQVDVLLPDPNVDQEESRSGEYYDQTNEFGWTVDVSGDGNVIVVGHQRDILNVFIRPAGGWGDAPERVTLSVANEDRFRVPLNSLAVSEDGKHVALATGGWSNGEGNVYVFTRPETGWREDATRAKLTAPLDPMFHIEESSVAIDDNGNTIALGVVERGGYGTAFMFLRPGPDWMDITDSAKLFPSDGVWAQMEGDRFGAAVAISSDGGTVVVGMPGKDAYSEDQGAAYVFVKPDAGWDDVNEVAKLTARGGLRSAGFGTTVALTHDGDVVIVGAPNLATFNLAQAGVYLFGRAPTGWADASIEAQFRSSYTLYDDRYDNGFVPHLAHHKSIDQTTDFIVVGGFGGGAYVLNNALATAETKMIDIRIPRLANPKPSTPDLRWLFKTDDPRWTTTMLAVDGTVYVGADKLYALNASTGDLLWTFGFEHYPGMSSPAVVDGVVYISSLRAGGVYALDASNGSVIASYLTQGGLALAPAAVEGVMYVGSGDDYLYAFDVSELEQASQPSTINEPLWRYETEGGVSSSPVVLDDVVYFVSMDGHVYAVETSSGNLLWRYEIGGEVPPWMSIGRSSPAVVDGVVYAGSYDGSVYALNSSTGELLWRYETGGPVYSSPTVLDGVGLFRLDGSSRIRCGCFYRNTALAVRDPLWRVFITGGGGRAGLCWLLGP